MDTNSTNSEHETNSGSEPSSPSSRKPKIFIVAQPLANGDVIGQALAEDGIGLAGHLSSNRMYVKHDMGINSRWKHEIYREYYPDGYELVDLTDLSEEELHEHEEFMRALTINRELEGAPGGDDEL